MKIHELINETETTEGVVGALGKGLIGVGKHLVGKGAATAAKTLIPKVGAKGAEYGTTALKFLKASNTALNILTVLGLGKLVSEYYIKIERAQAAVKSGDWTQAEFDDYRQGEMTKLVLEIASSTVFFSALKLFSGWSKWVYILGKVPLPAVKAFGVFLNTISETARVAFVAYLLSDKGKEAREAIGDLIGRGIVDNTLGGNGVALVDKVKHFFGLSQKTGEWKNPLDATAPGTAEPTADAEKNSTASTPASTAKSADDDSSYAYDKSKYTRSPTGALIPKVTIDN